MIISDVILLSVNSNIDREEIENQLTEKCGEVIRWAIIGVTGDNKLKISVSYVK